jgi:hypothetical protein
MKRFGHALRHIAQGSAPQVALSLLASQRAFHFWLKHAAQPLTRRIASILKHGSPT